MSNYNTNKQQSLVQQQYYAKRGADTSLEVQDTDRLIVLLISKSLFSLSHLNL